MIGFRVGTSTFDALIDNILSYVDEKAVPNARAAAIFVIKELTASGKDSYGKRFPKYSKEYAQWRSRKGYQTSPVNLIVTGRMLSSVGASNDEHGVVSVTPDLIKQVEGLQRRRVFMAYGEKMQAAIIKDEVNGLLKFL